MAKKNEKKDKDENLLPPGEALNDAVINLLLEMEGHPPQKSREIKNKDKKAEEE